MMILAAAAMMILAAAAMNLLGLTGASSATSMLLTLAASLTVVAIRSCRTILPLCRPIVCSFGTSWWFGCSLQLLLQLPMLLCQLRLHLLLLLLC